MLINKFLGNSANGKDGGSSGDMYLYSHHPSGHVWLVGRSLTTWSLRLNYLTYMKNIIAKNKKEKRSSIEGTLGHRICPIERQKREDAAPDMGFQYPVWEYIQSRKGEDEIWLKDPVFDFVCIS